MAIDSITQALGAVTEARDRLERETAAMADRSSRQLVELDEAIARVRTGRERVRAAIDDERARLERLGLEETRLGVDATQQQRRVERMRQQLERQERVIDLLERDVARARETAFTAAASQGQTQLRSGAARRAQRAQLEQSRSEIARCSAEYASAVATFEATPSAPPAASDLPEFAMRRERIEAELAAERQKRDAIPATRVATNFVERVWLERRQLIESDVARMERDLAALDEAEAEARHAIAEHDAFLATLRQDVDATRTRVLAAHRRFAILESTFEEDDARIARGVAEAETAAAETAMIARDLEIAALPTERVRLEEQRRELARTEQGAAELTARRDPLRQEIAEERVLRELMRELASLELALTTAVDERDQLERLVGRMRGAVL